MADFEMDEGDETGATAAVVGRLDSVVRRNSVRERLVIERQKTTFEWEVVAHPKNNIPEAMATLSFMRTQEDKKKYKGELRLVRETREIIDA